MHDAVRASKIVAHLAFRAGIISVVAVVRMSLQPATSGPISSPFPRRDAEAQRGTLVQERVRLDRFGRSEHR
jgi:hypothetical protein